ncbi:hypothetical protein D3C84_717880 [compost metagenome]
MRLGQSIGTSPTESALMPSCRAVRAPSYSLQSWASSSVDTMPGTASSRNCQRPHLAIISWLKAWAALILAWSHFCPSTTTPSKDWVSCAARAASSQS